jgi:hypothetical protein
MVKTGKSFENLVHIIEKALVESPNSTVQKNVFIKDKITGKPRQIDVLITINEGHHKMLISIECKDYSRKVGVNLIEAFKTKCENTGIAKGIYVSVLGFSSPALIKAKFFEIDCYTLAQAENLHWFQAPYLHFHQWVEDHTDIVIIPMINIDENITNFDIVNEIGQLITTEILMGNIIQKANLPIPQVNNEEKEVNSIFSGKGIYLLNKETKEKIPIKQINCKSRFHAIIEVSPFVKYSYSDNQKRAELGEFAIATVNMGQFHGDFIATENGDQRKILFVPKT